MWRHWKDGGIRLDVQKSDEDEKDGMRFISWRVMGRTVTQALSSTPRVDLVDLGVELVVDAPGRAGYSTSIDYSHFLISTFLIILLSNPHFPILTYQFSLANSRLPIHLPILTCQFSLANSHFLNLIMLLHQSLPFFVGVSI